MERSCFWARSRERGGGGEGGPLSNLSRRRPSYVSGQLDESSSKCKELYSLLRTNRAKTS